MVLTVSFFLIAAAIISFMSLQVGEVHTSAGMADRLNGQDSTAPLLLPLALFVGGVSGFLTALDWKPRGRNDGRV